MKPLDSETLQIPVTREFKQAFEAEAARLHLTPTAYLLYLVTRSQPGADTARIDNMVNEVFGRFGPAMRKLAQ